MVRQSCGARIDGREQNFSARGKFCTALCERPLHAGVRFLTLRLKDHGIHRNGLQ
jgi:hypothetical protein